MVQTARKRPEGKLGNLKDSLLGQNFTLGLGDFTLLVNLGQIWINKSRNLGF